MQLECVQSKVVDAFLSVRSMQYTSRCECSSKCRGTKVREDEPVSLHYLLNDRELRGLSYVCRLYKATFGREATKDPDLFVHLGDNPEKYLNWSARSGKIPTFRRTSGKMYHPQSETWLSPRDKLACLGFPVVPQAAVSMGVPVLPVLDNRRAHSIAGNSFHFATASVVQLVALCCYKEHRTHA